MSSKVIMHTWTLAKMATFTTHAGDGSWVCTVHLGCFLFVFVLLFGQCQCYNVTCPTESCWKQLSKKNSLFFSLWINNHLLCYVHYPYIIQIIWLWERTLEFAWKCSPPKCNIHCVCWCVSMYECIIIQQVCMQSFHRYSLLLSSYTSIEYAWVHLSVCVCIYKAVLFISQEDGA